MAELKQEAKDDDFKPIEAPKEIALPTDQINKDTVLFWIERSKNKNIVVYDALNGGNADHFNAVVGYWLDIDPEYVKAARKKGVQTDRVDLGFMEKKMAYGWSLVVDEASKQKKTYKLSIVSLPSTEMEVVTDAEGKPHAIIMINGKKCYLRKIYVETKESWYGMPKVLFVDIIGIEIDTGAILASRKTL